MNLLIIMLALSLVLNLIFGAMLLLQRVKAIVTKQAMGELLDRVAKLEEIARRPPEKITIVEAANKEKPNE